MSRNALTAIIDTACTQDRKMEAIKMVRNFNGMGLKEAKDFVEALQFLNKQTVQPFTMRVHAYDDYQAVYTYNDGSTIVVATFDHSKLCEEYVSWRNSTHNNIDDSAYN